MRIETTTTLNCIQVREQADGEALSSGEAGGKAKRLTIHGYCHDAPEHLFRLALVSDFEALRSRGGEYTLVYEDDRDCCIITSPVGAMHYFYTCSPRTGLVHGRRVLDILRRARLDWAWNWQALADLCQLENLTGNQTLHPEIQRVPPGTVLTYRRGSLNLDVRAAVDGFQSLRSDPAAAVRTLNEEVARCSGDSPYLSLSGGFDSRVILSSLLSQGIKPHLITMGSDSCSDVRVAREIARHFNLRHDLIRIELDDLIAHSAEISSLTNGTKTAWHWHTYLYPLKAAIPAGSSFFVGTLGEFARSYYFDRGRLGRVADLLPAQALDRFWSLKLRRHPTFLDAELAGLTPQFAAQLQPEGIRDRVERLCGYCHQAFLPGLTRYYFEQRVPNFYANGIAMYQASSQWRSPFHNLSWLETIWNLKPAWKLGSNWHRYAITQNCPALLDFPEENGFNPSRMLSKAPPLYWTPLMRRTPYVTYDRSQSWYREERLQALLSNGTPAMRALVSPETVRSILAQHRSGTDRTRSLAFLLTMAHWTTVLDQDQAT